MKCTKWRKRHLPRCTQAIEPRSPNHDKAETFQLFGLAIKCVLCEEDFQYRNNIFSNLNMRDNPILYNLQEGFLAVEFVDTKEALLRHDRCLKSIVVASRGLNKRKRNIKIRKKRIGQIIGKLFYLYLRCFEPRRRYDTNFSESEFKRDVRKFAKEVVRRFLTKRRA